MTEHETFPGKPYVVTSKAGCTITDASGELEEICEPGKQKVVHAPSEKLFTSAPAIVRETFNRAASVLRLLGGGVSDKWGKYAKCETVADLQAVNADYKNDLTADGEWKWKLPKFKTSNNTFQYGSNLKAFSVELPSLVDGLYMFQFCSSLTKIPVVYPTLTSAKCMFGVCNSLTHVELYCPVLTNADTMFGVSASIVSFKGELPALRTGSSMFTYCEAFVNFEADLPSLNGGSGMFNKCKLNKASALRVLSSIPAYTSGSHPLTIGIHVDHQTDEDVVNAIAEAEAKGWTLAVQWNGTPGTSTASTWGRRKPVFARLGEPMEDGTPMLDWGHYVTDPTGYTEFASLEEAKEHFNITEEV